MHPIVFTIGSFSLYSLSISFVLSWLIFSFLFWRSLRAQGVHEDQIFDFTFYATLVGFVTARVGFIVLHWDTFVGKSPLLMPALWIAPGLWWLGALVGALSTLVFLSRQRKVRLGLVLDALPVALGLPIILGELGSLLDGSEVGRITSIPWGVHLVGHPGLREPVQIYEMLALVVVSLIMMRMTRLAAEHTWPWGTVGVWFFVFYSASMFMLEFLKDSRVYWGNITANQWVLIGLFAESVGVLYVRGGGREKVRPFFRSIGTYARQIGKNIYAKFSHRHTHTDSSTS